MAQNFSNDSQPILDQQVISKLNRELGSERMNEVVTLFFEEGSTRIQQIRTAAVQGDLKRLQSLTHAFKPICSMLGLGRLYKQIKILADNSKHKQSIDTATHLSAIEQEYTQAIEALHQLHSQTD